MRTPFNVENRLSYPLFCISTLNIITADYWTGAIFSQNIKVSKSLFWALKVPTTKVSKKCPKNVFPPVGVKKKCPKNVQKMSFSPCRVEPSLVGHVQGEVTGVLSMALTGLIQWKLRVLQFLRRQTPITCANIYTKTWIKMG